MSINDIIVIPSTVVDNVYQYNIPLSVGDTANTLNKIDRFTFLVNFPAVTLSGSTGSGLFIRYVDRPGVSIIKRMSLTVNDIVLSSADGLMIGAVLDGDTGDSFLTAVGDVDSYNNPSYLSDASELQSIPAFSTNVVLPLPCYFDESSLDFSNLYEAPNIILTLELNPLESVVHVCNGSTAAVSGIPPNSELEATGFLSPHSAITYTLHVSESYSESSPGTLEISSLYDFASTPISTTSTSGDGYLDSSSLNLGQALTGTLSSTSGFFDTNLTMYTYATRVGDLPTIKREVLKVYTTIYNDSFSVPYLNSRNRLCYYDTNKLSTVDNPKMISTDPYNWASVVYSWEGLQNVVDGNVNIQKGQTNKIKDIAYFDHTGLHAVMIPKNYNQTGQGINSYLPVVHIVPSSGAMVATFGEALPETSPNGSLAAYPPSYATAVTNNIIDFESFLQNKIPFKAKVFTLQKIKLTVTSNEIYVNSN